LIRKRTPRDLLADIPGFADARVTGQLSSGPTNASYRIEVSGRFYVLRIDTPEAAALGLDRAAEQAVLEAVAKAGLGPEPTVFDPVNGIVIRPFVPGRSWTVRDLVVPANLERLARLLGRLHQLPGVGRAFDPMSAARRYAERLDSAEARRLVQEAARHHDQLAGGDAVLCHNDLVCQNILESDHLVLIDWEYAGAGDPWFDLAVVVEHHGLRPSLAQHFLEAYLGRAPVPEERQLLQRKCRFYRRLLDLWDKVVKPD
jgi:thiamine kinase